MNVFVVLCGRSDFHNEGGDGFDVRLLGVYSSRALAEVAANGWADDERSAMADQMEVELDDIADDEVWFTITEKSLDDA